MTIDTPDTVVLLPKLTTRPLSERIAGEEEPDAEALGDMFGNVIF